MEDEPVTLQTDHPDSYYDAERELFVQPDGSEVRLFLKEFEALQNCRASWGKLPIPLRRREAK